MTMKNGALSNKWGLPAFWKRIFHGIGAATGLLGAGLQAGTSSAATQVSAYSSAEAVPAAWLDYAKGLQSRFQQEVSGDGDAARRIQDFMLKHAGETNAPAPALVVRTWVQADGKIARIEFDGLDDNDVAASLRALLISGDVGVPPTDMLQPLRLRLSLRSKDQPGQGE